MRSDLCASAPACGMQAAQDARTTGSRDRWDVAGLALQVGMCEPREGQRLDLVYRHAVTLLRRADLGLRLQT